jgi:hypothetical protein
MPDLSGAITLLYTHGILSGRERDSARRRLALAAGTQSAETACPAQSEGCQSGDAKQRNAQNVSPPDAKGDIR